MDKNKNLLGQFALLCTALIWGSSFLIVKNTTESLPPLFLLAIRFTVAGILLGIIFYKRIKKMKKADFLNGVVIGLFLFTAYAAQTVGITDTTPGKNAFLTAVYCVLVPFLNWVVIKEKPGISSILAAVMCIAGIGCVALTDGLNIRTGDLLTILGGVLFAGHIIAINKCGRGRDPVVMTVMQFATAAVLSWIFGFITSPLPTEISLETFGGVMYLAVFATAAALLLQNVGQKYASPASSSIILSLESVFGVIFSIFFYNERPTPRMYLGFALIFSAVIVTECGEILVAKLKGSDTNE